MHQYEINWRSVRYLTLCGLAGAVWGVIIILAWVALP